MVQWYSPTGQVGYNMIPYLIHMVSMVNSTVVVIPATHHCGRVVCQCFPGSRNCRVIITCYLQRDRDTPHTLQLLYYLTVNRSSIFISYSTESTE